MCKKKKKKKNEETKPILKSNISGTLEVISLKFGMWSTEVGGHVHSKNRLVLSRKHKATEVRKFRFLSSCQYTQVTIRESTLAYRKLSRNLYHVISLVFLAMR